MDGAEALKFPTVSSDDIHITDASGREISSEKPNLMAQIDLKVGEPITISRGFAWIVGTALVLIPIVLMIALYLISGAMGYQTVISRVTDTEKRLDKVEAVVADIQTLKTTATIMQGDVKAIKDAQSSNEADRKDMVKNISDIRILLATKHINQ